MFKIPGLILTWMVLTAATIPTNAPVQFSPPAGSSMLPGGGLADTDIRTSFVFSKLIPFAIRYGIGLAVALAVLAIVIGGFQFMTSMGDAEKRGVAMQTLTYAVVGLVITLMAYGIVTIITKLQIFTSGPLAQ